MREQNSWGSFRPNGRDRSLFLNDMDLKFVDKPKASKPKVITLVNGHVSNLRDPDPVASTSTSARSGPLSGSVSKDKDETKKRRVRGRKPKPKAKDLSAADELAASLAAIKFDLNVAPIGSETDAAKMQQFVDLKQKISSQFLCQRLRAALSPQTDIIIINNNNLITKRIYQHYLKASTI
jgi:hypothetical protein